MVSDIPDLSLRVIGDGCNWFLWNAVEQQEQNHHPAYQPRRGDAILRNRVPSWRHLFCVHIHTPLEVGDF